MKISKLKSHFSLDYSKPLSDNPLFWWALFFPIVLALLFWGMLIYSGDLRGFDPTAAGLHYFWKTSTVPLSLISAAAIGSALIAAIHRSGQNARSTNQSGYYERIKLFRDYINDRRDNQPPSVFNPLQGGAVALFYALFTHDDTYNIFPNLEITNGIKTHFDELVSMTTMDEKHFSAVEAIEKLDQFSNFLHQYCSFYGTSPALPIGDRVNLCIQFLNIMNLAYSHFDANHQNPVPIDYWEKLNRLAERIAQSERQPKQV